MNQYEIAASFYPTTIENGKDVNQEQREAFLKGMRYVISQSEIVPLAHKLSSFVELGEVRPATLREGLLVMKKELEKLGK